MSLTLWVNHGFRPAALQLFRDSLARLGCRVLQSEKSAADALAAGEPDPLLAEADIAFGQPAPDEVIASPRLKWVALSTAGYARYDRPDFRAAMEARGTRVTNTSSVFANPCAEHTLAMMMAMARELPQHLIDQLGSRPWNYLEGRFTKETISGRTVVLLGYGAIGRRLVELLAPFRCRVIAVRRTPRGDEGIEVIRDGEVSSVLPLADHVVNLLPATRSTMQFCNTTFFAAMRRGAYFYNIGRGSTVDQVALLVALQSGHLAGAYLDALDPEPLPPSHALWSEPRCYITPHVAGGHREQDENLARHVSENVRRYLAGEPLVDRIM